MFDSQGYRLNVGMIVANCSGQLLWARRTDTSNAWQFPQGGIKSDETDQEALFRELNEELGLKFTDVDIVDCSSDWLSYEYPSDLIRLDSYPVCIGQKQRWFLLQLTTNDSSVNLNLTSKPEFDCWRWVDYWYPLKHVVEFKRTVYRRALERFEKPLGAILDKNSD